MPVDRRELVADPTITWLAALEGLQASIWTALPGRVLAFDPTKRTAQIQPTVQARINNQDGSTYWVNLPVLVDCPVAFPAGGDLLLTFPLAAGDEVLVIFSSRCIDNWWKSGGVRTQAELRMHDLSDGFVIPTVQSEPNVVAVDMGAAELRNKAGTSKVRLLNNGDVQVITPGNATVTAGAASVTAAEINLTGTVNITGTLNINGQNYELHQHSGVVEGTDSTGGVI